MDLSLGAATIVEARAPWREDFEPEWTQMPAARLRYVRRTGPWTLYHRDRNGRFHRYPFTGPSAKAACATPGRGERAERHDAAPARIIA